MFGDIIAFCGIIFLMAYGFWGSITLFRDIPKIQRIINNGDIIKGKIVNYETYPTALHVIRYPIVEFRCSNDDLLYLKSRSSLSFLQYPIGSETEWRYLKEYPKLIIHKKDRYNEYKDILIPTIYYISLIVIGLILIVCLY